MTNDNSIKIGIIGLDTSHVKVFTELLNDDMHPYHIPGGKVTIAYPGGSNDFELSYSRVEGFTEQLRNEFGVEIAKSPEEVAEKCDAILLESVDGRVHLEQFKRIAPFKKPVFIDKPFTVCSHEADEIIQLSQFYQIPLMSCSSLRYAEGLTWALGDKEKGEIIGFDCYGPMMLQSTQPGFFWYGIHTAEMLFSVLGKDCRQVTVLTNDEYDLVVGIWADGRIGTMRGNRKGNDQFGALLHRESGTHFVDVYAYERPYYASLLEHIIMMFRNGNPGIDLAETRQIVRFLEAANESRGTGKLVLL